MVLLLLLLPMLLVNAPLVMEAVRASCRLFVFSVMPGLFPYLTVTLMLLSRLPDSKPAWLVAVLGWCGGSPAGARLLRQCTGMDVKQLRRLAVTCATMSPMFLLGTVPGWLGSDVSGVCILAAVLLGGLIAGWMTDLGLHKRGTEPITMQSETPVVLPFGQAVEASARTMLMICGTMAMLRSAAALGAHYMSDWPMACLILQTLLEVTCGVEQLCTLPLPLVWRTALVAGAAGFGGMAIVMQNRSVLPGGLLSLARQVVLQLVHGLCSFLLALGFGLLLGL